VVVCGHVLNVHVHGVSVSSSDSLSDGVECVQVGFEQAVQGGRVEVVCGQVDSEQVHVFSSDPFESSDSFDSFESLESSDGVECVQVGSEQAVQGGLVEVVCGQVDSEQVHVFSSDPFESSDSFDSFESLESSDGVECVQVGSEQAVQGGLVEVVCGQVDSEQVHVFSSDPFESSDSFDSFESLESPFESFTSSS